jgi:hypothetical protein
MEATPIPLCDPPTLLAIIRAARQTHDRGLERAARQILRDQHGIELTFRRSAAESEVRHER